MSDIIREIENEALKEISEFNVGDTVKVHGKIKEGNRERIQIYEGTVIKIQGTGARKILLIQLVRRLSSARFLLSTLQDISVVIVPKGIK